MSYSIDLDYNQSKQIISKYQGYSLPITNKYINFRAKIGNTTMTLFSTNKLLIQGKGEHALYLEICAIFDIIPLDQNKTKVKNIELNRKVHYSTIGSDEVGTGDFFGPIVVCAAYVDKDQVDYLYSLGINDSKLLTDSSILNLAPKLMSIIKYSYMILDNITYNKLVQTKKMNMNKIKACMHNQVICNLKNKVTTGYDSVIIDAFTDSNNYFKYLQDQKNVISDVILIEKAEKLFASVACASIIARFLFLNEMQRLSSESGYQLLKGASSEVDKLSANILKEKDSSFLYRYAKMNFKNYEKSLLINKKKEY